MSLVRCTVFLTYSITSSEYVRTECPWGNTTDTVEITGVSPHTMWLAEIDSLRSIIEALNIYLNSDIKNTRREELDAREVGVRGFLQSNIILSKLDRLLVQNQELQVMNDARNMDNNCTSGIFMNQSGPSLNRLEFDPKDDIFIMVDKDLGMMRVLTKK